MIKLFDTTLRDGSQAEGISFSPHDKLRVALELDRLGVEYIEGGWPGSNPKDNQFFKDARKLKFKNAKLVAFGSTRRKGIPASRDANLKDNQFFKDARKLKFKNAKLVAFGS